MNAINNWAIGVDIGGTKIEVSSVDRKGNVDKKVRRSTNVQGGPNAVEQDICLAIKELCQGKEGSPVGVGIGMAGQIEAKTGLVVFAPNLQWHNVPLQANLKQALDLPVVVTNDVRAAAIGEWVHGAGKGSSNIVCLFLGTGIGGGIVINNHLYEGSSNTAGEFGHTIVDLNGPPCTCRSWGCVETYAGGWAIGKRAKDNPSKLMLELVEGNKEAITAKTVEKAYRAGDPAAIEILEGVKKALVACGVNIVQSLNPERLIIGGGIADGFPEVVGWIDAGVRQRAFKAALTNLTVMPAILHNSAGGIGAGTLALQQFSKE